MQRAMTRLAIVSAAGLGMLGLTAGAASAGNGDGPTCAGLGGITVHGQHIVGDYVMGGGHGIGGGEEWPFSHGMVGQMVSDNGGAAVPGGPGPGFHFPNGFAPGASFCNDSNSPGNHIDV